MRDPLEYVNELISGNHDLYRMATAVMGEYEDAIEERMQATAGVSIQQLDPDKMSRMTMEETVELAEILTIKRLKDQVDIFYKEEIERLMDAFNDGLYTSEEYNIRCGIITQYNYTMNYDEES